MQQEFKLLFYIIYYFFFHTLAFITTPDLIFLIVPIVLGVCDASENVPGYHKPK